MKESCAISTPGESLIGTRVRLFSSSVSVPFQPGSQKPAVACTISPSRPSEDLPSIRATMSSGSSTHSSVRPRQNSPGWITNASSGAIFTSDVRFAGRSLRSIDEMRWLSNTRNVSPRRRSTLAGCTSEGSHGSILMRPASTSSRIVPSDSTEVGWGVMGAKCASRGGLPLGRARASDRRAHAWRGGGRGIPVWAATWAWRRRASGRIVDARAAVALSARLLLVLGRLSNRPPDEVQQHPERDLQRHHDEQEARPLHGCRCYPRWGAVVTPRVGASSLHPQRQRSVRELRDLLELADARDDLFARESADALGPELLDVVGGDRGAVGHGAAQRL